MNVRELTDDRELTASFELMHSLRPQLERESYLPTLRRQQAGGYRLYGGYVDDSLVCLAGVRDGETLARGPHLFVDDLVTSAAEQGKGYGTAMLKWLAIHARSRGFERMHLDSRATARGFYEQVGFEMHSSIPCSIEVSKLAE